MQFNRKALFRTIFAIVASFAYWISTLGIWVIFFLGTILGDCIGPDREACIHRATIWLRAELVVLPLIVAAYIALVIWFRRRWKFRPV